jgi:hypothetical protein
MGEVGWPGRAGSYSTVRRPCHAGAAFTEVMSARPSPGPTWPRLAVTTAPPEALLEELRAPFCSRLPSHPHRAGGGHVRTHNGV